MPLVGCAGSDFLAASACSATRGALTGNLHSAPAGEWLGVSGTCGMGVVDDLVRYPSFYPAGRASGTRRRRFRRDGDGDYGAFPHRTILAPLTFTVPSEYTL